MRPVAEDLLAPADWTFPVPIHYGPGRIGDIASLCQAAGIKRPLLVTDRNTRELAFFGRIVELLQTQALPAGIYAGFSPNPRDDEVAAGREQFQADAHDGVIAIGGGSGMDGGKALATVANNTHDLRAFEYERAPPAVLSSASFPPLITVPTTAGTGAETESTAMITDTARAMKFCTWHPALKPACTVLDPELTVGLPPSLTAWTGLDALVHAIEAYVVPGFHPLCDGAALEGLRLINRWLRAAVEEPDNIEARGGMLVGSSLAGIAFLKGLGLVHAISHMVGAEFDTHHGLTNAVTLPAVMRFNESAMAPAVAPLGQSMGLSDGSFDTLYRAITDLLDEMTIPRTLGDLDIPVARAAALAEKAALDSAATTNPRIASTAEIQSVIEDAVTVGR